MLCTSGFVNEKAQIEDDECVTVVRWRNRGRSLPSPTASYYLCCAV